MLHTIKADFYRLFRSKGFWVTELILLGILLMGVLFGATGRIIGVNTTPSETITGSWTGIEALIKVSGNGSNLVFFSLVLASLVLGVDLTQKLYKNILTVGISRTQFYLAKFLVLASLALFQIVVSLVTAFLPAALLNGIGNAPEGFLENLLITILLQFLCILAWLSIVSFVLYLTHSIAAVFVSYTVVAILLSMPLLFFPDIVMFRYLALDFSYSMTADTSAIFYVTLFASLIFAFFGVSGLLVFQKKSL